MGVLTNYITERISDLRYVSVDDDGVPKKKLFLKPRDQEEYLEVDFSTAIDIDELKTSLGGVFASTHTPGVPMEAASLEALALYLKPRAIAAVTGMGVADDLAAINAAILSTANAGGGRAHVPFVGNGICLLTGPVIIRSKVVLTIDHGVVMRLQSGSNTNILQNSAVALTGSSAMDAAIAVGSQDVVSSGFVSGNIGQPFTIWGAGVDYGPLSGTVTGVGTGSLAHSRTLVDAGITNGSPTLVSNSGNFSNFDKGRLVGHSAYPAGTYILEAISPTVATTSASATGPSVTGATVTITGATATYAVSGPRIISDATFSNVSGVGMLNTASGSLTDDDIGRWIISSRLATQVVIASRIDANNAALTETVTTPGAATATIKSGTYVGIGPRDTDWAVVGGIWDHQTNDGVPNVGSYICKFRRADRWMFKPEKIVGGKRNGNANYAINPGDCSRFRIDAEYDTPRDGIHVSGPAFNYSVRGRGTSGDDFAVAAIGNYPLYVDCIGPIEDGYYDLDFIGAKSGFSIIGNSTIFKARRIRVKMSGRITSVSGSTARIVADTYMAAGTLVEGLTIESSHVDNPNGAILFTAKNVRDVVINDYVYDGKINAIRVAGGVVESMTVNSMRAEGGTTGGLVLIDSGARLDSLNMNGVTAKLGTNGRVVQNNSTSPLVVSSVGHNIQGNDVFTGWLYHQPLGAGSIVFTLGPGLVKGLNRLANTSAISTLILAGTILDSNLFLGLTGASAANLRVIGGGHVATTASDTNFSKTAGSTITVNGASLRVNRALIDTAASIEGDMHYNTNAVAATVGLYVLRNGAWEQLGASVKNTLFTAKGSLVTASAASTPVELTTIGVPNGYVLTKQADGSAVWSAGTPGPVGPAPNARPIHTGRGQLVSSGRSDPILMVGNRLYLVCWNPQSAWSFTKLGLYITAAGSAGAVLRFGWYPDDGTNQPSLSSPIEYGSVASTSTGMAEVIASDSGASGPRWLGVVSQGAPTTHPTVYMVGTSYADSNQPIITGANLFVSGYFLAGITGLFPTAGALADSTPTSPLFRVWGA